MKIKHIIVLLCLSTKIFAQKEIRTYAAVNLTNPKDRFSSYKGSINIEGAVGLYLGELKLGNKFGLGVEPIGKLKWYGFKNKNVVNTDYSISVSELGGRIYPIFNIGKGVLRNIGKALYVDISYSKIKLVKVNIINDEIVNTISYGYGINLPIYNMSDLGIPSELTLTAGVQQYSWKTPAGTKSSFAGRQIGLSFAIKLGAKKKVK